MARLFSMLDLHALIANVLLRFKRKQYKELSINFVQRGGVLPHGNVCKTNYIIVNIATSAQRKTASFLRFTLRCAWVKCKMCMAKKWGGVTWTYTGGQNCQQTLST